MKTVLLVTCTYFLALSNCEENIWKYMLDFVGGTFDMLEAYNDMHEANHRGSDHYFRARGNSEASMRGRGGSDAAALISNGKSFIDSILGKVDKRELRNDRNADRWGRLGGDPRRFRPLGLDPKY